MHRLLYNTYNIDYGKVFFLNIGDQSDSTVPDRKHEQSPRGRHTYYE